MIKNSRKLGDFHKRLRLITIHYLLSTIFLIFTLFTIHYSLSTAFAQEETLTLEVTVTNPSDTETQEVPVRVSLPAELKKEDIIFADGLKVVFDTGKDCLFAEDAVILRPAETTIYRIEVKDIWKISEGELKDEKLKVKNEIKNPELLKTFIAMLNKILVRQKESVEDVGTHIAAYRKNRKELTKIREEVANYSSHSPERQVFPAYGTGIARTTTIHKKQWFWVVVAVLAVFMLIKLWQRDLRTLQLARIKKARLIAITALRRIGIFENRRYLRIKEELPVEYSTLSEPGKAGVTKSKDLCVAGVNIFTEERIEPQVPLELTLMDGEDFRSLKVKGVVAWQSHKPDLKEGDRSYYSTGINFAEMSFMDKAKLMHFIYKLLKESNEKKLKSRGKLDRYAEKDFGNR